MRELWCKFGPEPYSAIICGALSAFNSFVARRNASDMMDGIGRHEKRYRVVFLVSTGKTQYHLELTQVLLIW